MAGGNAAAGGTTAVVTPMVLTAVPNRGIMVYTVFTVSFTLRVAIVVTKNDSYT